MNTGQYIDLTFDQTVAITNFSFSSWGSNSVALVSTNGVSVVAISEGGDTECYFEVEAGVVTRVEATGQTGDENGLSFDDFSVIAIPEPAVLSVIGLFLIGLYIKKRRF